MIKSTLLRQQTGAVFPTALILGVSFLAIAIALMQLSITYSVSAKRGVANLRALALAEAGVDHFMSNINADSTYTGTNTSCPISGTGSNPFSLFNDSTQGKGTFETCTTAGSIPGEKIVYATGKFYASPSASNPASTRKVKVTIHSTTTGDLGVHSGAGGLILGNNTVIAGNVHVNGGITMEKSYIGTDDDPVNVSAANAKCPAGATPGPTYPAACSTNNPIVIGHGQGHIYGDVKANNQVDYTSQMTEPGLTSTSGVAVLPLPDWDREGVKTAVNGSGNTMTGAQAGTCTNNAVTWPANVKITGNVTIPIQCTATAMGHAWITGNLTINGILVTHSSLSAAPTVMIDGSTGLRFGNNATVATNSSNIGFKMITYWSAAACSPDCSSVTGNDLKNSESVLTIDFGNGTVVSGSSFYARWTKLYEKNNGTVGSFIGQTVELKNGGNLSFAGTTGSGPTVWDVVFYERI